MDLRKWQCKSPWEKRTYLLCFVFYLCLLLHVTVADAVFRQESKNEVQDSSKLDSLNSFLPYDSKEDIDYKRASSFFPLRGKKSSADDSTDNHQLVIPDDVEEKRSLFFPLRGKKVPDNLKRASYFMPMRGRKDDGWIDEDYEITDETPNKRASSFMPMRGKKKYEAISDYLAKAGTYSKDVSEILNPSNSNSYQSADKRLPSFVPLRGKRSYVDAESSSNEQVSLNGDSRESAVLNHSAKKRSVSFMPMRGRRDFSNYEDDNPGNDVTSLLEKKKYSFMPMRGRRENDYDEQVDKKATFLPMRGRKSSEDEALGNFQDESLSKRAQYFMPMRGRRTQLRDIVNESPNVPEIESRLIQDKRASSFMPMRGRRSLLEDSGSNLDKKVSSFTLMRRRRSTDYLENGEKPKSSFESEKRATFLPMRGRKSADDDFEVEPWPADQLMSILDKKAYAFMPMRGRRFVDRNITVEPWQVDQLMSLFNKKSYSFLPMRGRRFAEGNITVDPWQADQLMSLFNKKTSFLPMRGRRFEGNFTVEPWQMDQLMSLFNKKSAFLPMRGRRDNWDVSPQVSKEMDYDENDSKRGSYFMPMRGRRFESREMNFYNPYSYLMAGIGSSLMSKPYGDAGLPLYSVRSANERRKKLRINWDAVKRAFHATRGKRFHEVDDFVQSPKDSYPSGVHDSEEETNSDTTDDSTLQTRTKRSIMRSRLAMQPSSQYIALKRPMSFFATRGKRLDDSAIDNLSKLH